MVNYLESSQFAKKNYLVTSSSTFLFRSMHWNVKQENTKCNEGAKIIVNQDVINL